MLRIISSNRQEALFAHLAERLATPSADTTRPGSLLAAQTLIVEKGIDTWLWQQLAGEHGIAACLAMEMPGDFIWKTLRSLVADFPEESPFERASVTWRLMTLLPQHLHKTEFADLRHYLVREPAQTQASGNAAAPARDAQPDPRRLHALCTRIASVFDQYLVYRPELILAWEAGRERGLGSDESWQKILWNELVKSLAEKGHHHRAHLMREFDKRFRAGQLDADALKKLPPRISVFGIPALPPNYMIVLAQLANLIDVDFYLLNPSTMYWGDQLEPSRAAKLCAQLNEHGAALVEVNNRLLASWGQHARDFIAALHGEYSALCPTDHDEKFVEIPGKTRLAQLQTDILELKETPHNPAEHAQDTSIRIHGMHGRLREVEVLHDQLLDLFQHTPGLQPRDVLVMAPDIAAYAPLIDAVFGTASDERRLPWTIADLPPRAEEPLLAAIEQLIRLSTSRLRASDVLGLLEMPAIRRAARIEDAHLDDIRHWVSVANIRWGYDGAHREELGLPAENTHTWAFGLRRLFLGAAVSGHEELLAGHEPFSTVAPCTQVEGQRATALGLLCSFVDALHDAQPLLAGKKSRGAGEKNAATDGTLTPARWQQTVNGLLNQFIAARGDNEQSILDLTREALARQVNEMCSGGQDDTPIDTTVLRDDLIARLASPGRRNDFLGGNITFASLLPQRSLPFRVIALLGMNQEDFPRQSNAVGFDLLARQPRAGDRSRRNDDRHLFLETLLSARDVLYISFTGRDIRDDKPRLPSVLVTELIEYLADAAGGTRRERENFRKTFVREHPLQPFSARYFLPQPAKTKTRAGELTPPTDHLFTYNRDWHGAASARAGETATAKPWYSQPLPPRADDAGPGGAISIDELVRFLRNPTAWFLQQRFSIRFRDEHDIPPDEEPFELDALDGWAVKTGWVNAALSGTNENDFRRQLAARGELPEGALEHLHWRAQQASVGTLLDELKKRGSTTTVSIDILVGAQRITGQVGGVTDGGLVGWKAGSIDGKDALAFWVRHLALCAQGELGSDAVSCLLDKEGQEQLQVRVLPKNEAGLELAALLALRERGRLEPLPLFAKANWKWFSTENPDKALDAARAAFDGGYELRGDVLDPAIRIAWRCGEEAIGAAFVKLAEAVYHPIRLRKFVAEKPERESKPKAEKTRAEKPAKKGSKS